MNKKINAAVAAFFMAFFILIGTTGCPQPDDESNNNQIGMQRQPDGSYISGVFTQAPNFTFVTGNNDGEIRYSWTVAEPRTGVSYRLYVIEGEVTDPNVIISDGNVEDTASGARLVGIFPGERNLQYSAVVVAQVGTSTADRAFSAVRTASPRQFFQNDPILTFATGDSEGEINISWTAVYPTVNLSYNLYIFRGTTNNVFEIVTPANLFLTTPGIWNGTFNSFPGNQYSAVLQVVSGSSRVNSPVMQAAAKGRESLGTADIRFGVISDTHIGGIGRGAGSHPIPGLPSPGFYPTHNRLAKALQWFEAQDGLNTLFITGDLIQGGNSWGFNGGMSVQNQYTLFGDTLNQNKGNLQVISVKGNHDETDVLGFFRDATGGLEPNAHYVIGGYHFITLVGGAGNNNEAFQASVTWENTTDQAGGGAIAAARPVGVAVGSQSSNNAHHFTPGILSWLRERIEFARDAYIQAGTPGRPIFIFSHWPPNNTSYGSEGYGSRSFGIDPLNGFFADDPEVVLFAGHTHRPNNDPRSIWQGTFTSVNVPSLYWMSMESGFLGVNDNGTTDGITNRTTPPVANFSTGQGLVVSVSGTVVTIKNFDFDMNLGPTPQGNIVRIPQTWVFDTARPNEFPHTSARADQRTAPVFDFSAPSNAALENMITLSNIERNSVNVEFIQARMPTVNPAGEIVHSYRFEFRNVNTGGVIERAQWSDFMLTPRLQRPKYSQFIGGLAASTEYELRIFAFSSFQAVSTQYLTIRFTTAP
ncbi:MAG: metallophosphoesterase [Treponema sp.]|nr:metallophosphoesterase [Treponema sp.]